MKAWKKAVAVSSLGISLALGGCFGGYSAHEHRASASAEQVKPKRDYKKLLDSYRRLDISGLVYADLHYKHEKSDWMNIDREIFYTPDREEVLLSYTRNHAEDRKELYKTFRKEDKPEERLSFKVWFTMDGRPYSITYLAWHKETCGGETQVKFHDVFTLLKDEQGCYTDIGDSYYSDNKKSIPIADKDLLEHVKGLFDAAGKDYAIVEDVIRKQ